MSIDEIVLAGEVVTRLAGAALRLTRDLPYLATAIWVLERFPRPGLGTLAVDRYWRLYYDPAVVVRWSVSELAGVLYHEVCHLLRDHAGRAVVTDDPHRWNLATDAEINNDLKAEGIILPGHPVCPSGLGQEDGKLAEEYYAALPAAPTAKGDSGGAGEGRCGSCATGRNEHYEEPAPDDGSRPSGLTPTESALVRQMVARDILDHARSRGNVPTHMRRWAEAWLQPQVDWRRELASAIRRSLGEARGAVDYTYHRPSRRQSCFGSIVVPTLVRPNPQVAVVVDTSGSMSPPMLGQALAELGGVLRAAGARDGVRALAVDAAVNACQRIIRPEQLVLLGGGGTDMGRGLEAAARLRPVPDAVIVLTDGLTPWPERAPRCGRVIVALFGGSGTSPPWARTVRVPG